MPARPTPDNVYYIPAGISQYTNPRRIAGGTPEICDRTAKETNAVTLMKIVDGPAEFGRAQMVYMSLQ
jgi:hypothetical protein